MKIRIKTLEELKDFAEVILEKARANKDGASVIALYGDLGAGKTALTKEIAKIFEIKGNITSPTFVIEKIYNIKDKDFSKLVHIDAYRLKGAKDLLPLGWGDLIKDKGNLIVVEWADLVEDALPKNALKIKLTFVDSGTRDIQFPYGGQKD